MGECDAVAGRTCVAVWLCVVVWLCVAVWLYGCMAVWLCVWRCGCVCMSLCGLSPWLTWPCDRSGLQVPLKHPYPDDGAPIEKRKAHYLNLADAVAVVHALAAAGLEGVPTVWGCDMNAQPGDPVIDYVTKRGTVSRSQAQDMARALVRHSRWQGGDGRGGTMVKWASHGMELASAYAKVLGEEPEVTNLNVGFAPEDAERCFAACLDYVFYTSTSLVPRRVLDVYKFSKALFPRDRVPLEMLAKMCLGNTPNGAVPSDHFPMAVVFAL